MNEGSPLEPLVAEAMSYADSQLPRAWGGPGGRGTLRAGPADFFVEEDLGFEPDGEGEHLFVFVEKKALNTADVAEALRRCVGIKPVDVSFAGLKDRHAITRQWFSLYLPGKADPDMGVLEGEQLRILRTLRHSRKLRRGVLRGNRFRLRVRDFTGDADRVGEVLARIAAQGFPNYFGAQRFGRANSNLVQAAQLFDGSRRLRRPQKSLCLSAARSMLFNRVLAARVAGDNWQHPLPGEVFQIAGRKSLFRADALDEELHRRCEALEIHPTGPLWGRGGRVWPSGPAAAAEQAALADLAAWQTGLEAEGLEGDRRALRAVAGGLEWEEKGNGWELTFSLGRGVYATSLMREWLAFTDASGEPRG